MIPLLEIILLNKPIDCRLITVFINKVYVQIQIQEIIVYTDNNIDLNNICLQIRTHLNKLKESFKNRGCTQETLA